MLGQLLAETFLPSAGVLPEHQSAADKAMKEAMVRSCVQAISRLLGHAGGEAIGSDAPSSPLCPDGPNMASKRVAGWLLESLSDVVCPEKPEPNYLLVLEKAPTQEEFIRGSMNGNPYSSSEVRERKFHALLPPKASLTAPPIARTCCGR